MGWKSERYLGEVGSWFLYSKQGQDILRCCLNRFFFLRILPSRSTQGRLVPSHLWQMPIMIAEENAFHLVAVALGI